MTTSTTRIALLGSTALFLSFAIGCGDNKTGTPATDASTDTDTDTGTVDAGPPDTGTDTGGPCDMVAMPCATEGRTCEMDVLVDCAMDTAGCLEETRTDCAATAGGVCDPTATPVACAAPLDPCAGVAGACTTAGTTCDVDTLVTCAPDAFGCLVETRDDCTARASGTCDATAAPPACAFTGDPCAAVTECAAASVACEGPELVTCAADGFGCLVETRSDCTSLMYGFCDEMAATHTCSTAATDPCMGVTECMPVDRTCGGTTLTVCAPNALGCNTETVTDCTTADPEAFCATGGTTAMCENACARAETTVLDCASGTVMADTAMGTATVTAYPDCTTLTSYARAEQVFRFRNAGLASVQIVATRLAGTGDHDLFVVDGTDGTVACDGTSTCLDSSTSTSAAETVNFDVQPGQTVFAIYDLYGSSGTDTTDYSLAITCVEPTCGDSTVEGPETCEDGNTTAGDGCSDLCQIETGYICTGSPSVCVLHCGDSAVDTAQGETCDDGGTTAGDGCDDTCHTEMGYICSGAPSVCALHCGNSTVDGAAGESCDDGGTTAGDGCDDTCQIEMGYSCTGAPSVCTLNCGNGTLETGEQCDDSGIATGDGCDAMCQFESGFFCTAEPSTCTAVVCGNSTIDGGEGCDDGNTTGGDGCSALCATETAAAGASVALAGSLDATDPTWARASAGCFSGSGTKYYDAFVIENTTGVDQILTITAAWPAGGDGYLHAFRYPFNAALERFNCIGGNDDFTGTTDSQLTGITIAAGERIYVIASTWASSDAIGAYTIDVATN